MTNERRVAATGVRFLAALVVLCAVCAGCETEFVYRKPTPSTISHFKSPLLPPIKGNWDDGDDH